MRSWRSYDNHTKKAAGARVSNRDDRVMTRGEFKKKEDAKQDLMRKEARARANKAYNAGLWNAVKWNPFRWWVFLTYKRVEQH